MKLLAAFLLLAAAAGPALAQDTETDRLKKEVDRLKVDNEVLLRQLEVVAAQMKELNEKASKKADVEKPPVAPGLKTAEEARSALELAKQLAEMRTAELALAEESRRKGLEESRRAAGKLYGFPAPPAPPMVVQAPKSDYPLSLARGRTQGKVTAVAAEIDLVVISVGRESGVKEGDEYSMYRNGEFIGKLKVDRADARWAAGKVSLKKENPRVGDEVTILLPVGSAIQDPIPAPVLPAPAPAPPYALGTARASAEELRSLRKELDEVRSQVRQLSDRLVPAWQGPGVAVEEAPEELRAHLGIPRGLLVRRIREGSTAEKAGLKANDIIPELMESQLLDALEKRLPVNLIRQGQRMTSSSPK